MVCVIEHNRNLIQLRSPSQQQTHALLITISTLALFLSPCHPQRCCCRTWSSAATVLGGQRWILLLVSVAALLYNSNEFFHSFSASASVTHMWSAIASSYIFQCSGWICERKWDPVGGLTFTSLWSATGIKLLSEPNKKPRPAGRSSDNRESYCGKSLGYRELILWTYREMLVLW